MTTIEHPRPSVSEMANTLEVLASYAYPTNSDYILCLEATCIKFSLMYIVFFMSYDVVDLNYMNLLAIDMSPPSPPLFPPPPSLDWTMSFMMVIPAPLMASCLPP